MTKISEATLSERASYVYRKLLLLQRLFQVSTENENADWIDAGDQTRNLELCSGILEVLDDIAEQARVLTTVPLPLPEWRPGDRADDERWRAFSEIERRELLSLLSSYADLITWCEAEIVSGDSLEGRGDEGGASVAVSRQSPRRQEAVDHLKAERARLARFRQEAGFLDRRSIPEIARLDRPRTLDS
jgi:hypothetical protein